MLIISIMTDFSATFNMSIVYNMLMHMQLKVENSA